MQTNFGTLLHPSMLTMLSLRSWLLTQSSVKYLLVKDKLQMSKCCQAIVAPSTTIKESWANNSFLFSLPLWCLVLSLFDSLVSFAICICCLLLPKSFKYFLRWTHYFEIYAGLTISSSWISCIFCNYLLVQFSLDE